MKYKAILFDLDGTLLPMDMHTFTKGYFKMLYMKLAKHKLNPETFASDMWAGVAAMVKNDGTRSNEDAFWSEFEKAVGIPKERIDPDCLDFYSHEFDAAKQYTQPNPLAKQAVEIARGKAEKVVLATNPLFPLAGQITRMRWVGLTVEDFDLVTSYEVDRCCKPNPDYYRSVCTRIGVEPEDCLMIGNDEEEDMFAATCLGMDAYLVTDCAIPSEAHPWTGRRGSFAELVEYLKTLN